MPSSSYTAADVTRAARRCAELARIKPHWPRARVRRTVAEELGVSTATLRYLLRQASARQPLTPCRKLPEGARQPVTT